MPARPEVVVLGGGLTGISAALHLRRRYLLLEKESRLGGTARSERRHGFTFDQTGHWLHLRDPAMRRLVEDVTGGRMLRVERKARIFANGALTRYPFQANLFGQPPAVIEECLLGFIEAWHARASGGASPVDNFERFCLETFGQGISRHFMIPYNHRLWGVHPREITAAWCQRFVPVPRLEEVVAGAVGRAPAEMGYNIAFEYPAEGGIEALVRALAARLDPERGQVVTGASPEDIDVEERSMRVGGDRVDWDAIVSTIPLPELLRRIRNLPPEIEAAAARLRCTAVRYFDVATRTASPADWHWIYVPESQYPFYRVGIYSNAARSMAPPLHASLYVELAERGPRPAGAALDALGADVRHGLAAAGAIASPDDVLFADLQEIEYAYVVYDQHYVRDTALLRGWLEERRIYPRGRYGAWVYNAMEDCLLAGRQVAELLGGGPPAGPGAQGA